MKTALFVVPTDEAGGAEKIFAMVASRLARSELWNVRIQVLAQQAQNDYLARRCPGAEIFYGGGSGRFGSELSLVAVLRAHDFDLVYATHIRVNAFLSMARRLGLLRCKRLVTRESTTVVNRFFGLRLLFYRFLYSLYGGQDTVICQTESMAESVKKVLRESNHSKILVAANPVDVPLPEKLSGRSQYRNTKPGWPIQLVWCGRFIPIKNPIMAVDVLASLRRQLDREIGLVMIGSGPLEGQVAARVTELGLDDAVEMTGQLDDPLPVFSASQCGLITSSAEGFPNVVLEMLACGVSRVVTTPCAGGLDETPGVVVVPGVVTGPMVSALTDGIHHEGPRDPAIEQALLKRNPDAFVSLVIGHALNSASSANG